MLPLTDPEHFSVDFELTTDSRVAAEALREQAASCRRLASVARTPAGRISIEELGDHFDEQARKLDPASLKR